MLETILAVAGLVILIALLVVALCIVAHMCFGQSGGLLNYLLFGREAMELIFQAIGWCLYAIATAIAESGK